MGNLALLLVFIFSAELQGQDNETTLARHVPSEFARTKLTLDVQDGLSVVLKGERQLTTRELFDTVGLPERYQEFAILERSAEKYKTRARWLHSLARFSVFGSLYLGASRLERTATLHEWLPAIEMATFGSYVWIMARRYDYRWKLIQKDQLEILSELNLEQWVADYNLQLYQKLIESGLTFSE